MHEFSRRTAALLLSWALVLAPRWPVSAVHGQSDPGQLDSAIESYERALAAGSGTSITGDPIIRFNLATLHAAKGIDAFQADNLEDAIASFRSSLGWNPYSRDIRYNLCMAMYIQASRLVEQGTPPAGLRPLYSGIVTEASKVRDADPANPNLLLILGYAHRNLGDEIRAASAFAEKTSLPVEILDVRMEVGPSATALSGVVRNLMLKEGEPLRLRFTMIALDGSAMASSDVETRAPALDQKTAFSVRIATTQDVAGWRYDIR